MHPSTDQLPPGSGERLLRQVAGWLIPGSPPIDAPADEMQAGLCVARAYEERLAGPLLLAVDGGGLALPEHLVDRVERIHRESMTWCVHLECRLLEVANWFADAGGVDFLVIKGPAVAHLDEPEPSLRSFADIDLLVRADHMDRALDTLANHGAMRRVPERRPGFDRRFVKSVGLRSADGVELDVHRTLCSGVHGLRIPLGELFAGAASFDIGDQLFAAPSLVHRMLHAAYHAVIGTPEPSLRTLRDLAGYMTRNDLPLAEVEAEAHRWRGQTVLAEAVRLTLDMFAIEAAPWRAWLDDVEVDRRELALIERSRTPSRWPLDLAMTRELGWRDGAAFAWAVAMPSRTVLDQRGVTAWGRLTSGVRQLTGGRGKRAR